MGVVTCIRPKSTIYGTMLQRYVTSAEAFRCQGMFTDTIFEFDRYVEQKPDSLVKLAGYAFTSSAIL